MSLELLGQGLQLAGGLLGLGGGSSPSDQSYGQLKGAFKAADEHGIHRLAVAGSPAGYSPAPMSAADGLLAAGDALRGNDKKQEELIDAQIAEARSRTVLNEANARRASVGPSPHLNGSLPSIVPGGGADGRDLDIRPQVNEAFWRAMGRPDNPVWAVNEPVDLSELLGSLIFYGPQALFNRAQDAAQSEPTGRGSRPKDRAPIFNPTPSRGSQGRNRR